MRDQLYIFISKLNLKCMDGLDDDTALFESGVLDSLSLMRLAQWIEEQIEGDLDLTQFNILEAWRTPGAIVDFVEARRVTRLPENN